MKRKLVGLLAFTSLFAAACGGGSSDTSKSSTTEKADAKEISSATLELVDLPDPLLSEADADNDFDLNVVWAVAPFSLDPHKEFEAFVGFGYDSLIMFDHQRQLMPGVAESFEVSEDQKTMTFKIRDDMKFSDGTTVDSSAVKASIERAQTFEESKYKGVLANIESVTTPAPDTAEITLSEPDSNVVLALAGPAGSVINPAALADGVDLASEVAGTTPLDVVEFEPGNYIKWARDDERAADYFDKAAFRFATISVTESVDRTAVLNGLQSGTFNLTLFGGPTEQAESQLGDDFNYAQLRSDSARSLWLNSKLDGPLQDRSVRQAIVQAIDREAIGGNIIPRCEPMTQLARSGTPAHVEGLDPFPYDPEAAAEVLDGKGIKLDFVTSVSPEEVAAATAMQQNLKDVGVEISIEQLPIVEGQQALATTPIGYFAAAPKADFSISIENLWLNPPFNAAGPDDEDSVAAIIGEVSALPLGSSERDAALQELNETATGMALQVPICASSSLWLSSLKMAGADTMQNGWASQFGPRYVMMGR